MYNTLFDTFHGPRSKIQSACVWQSFVETLDILLQNQSDLKRLFQPCTKYINKHDTGTILM